MNIPTLFAILTVLAIEWHGLTMSFNLEAPLPTAMAASITVYLVCYLLGLLYSRWIDNPAPVTYEVEHHSAWEILLRVIHIVSPENGEWREKHPEPMMTDTVAFLQAKLELKDTGKTIEAQSKPRTVVRSVVLKAYLTENANGTTEVKLKWEVNCPMSANRLPCNNAISTTSKALDAELRDLEKTYL